MNEIKKAPESCVACGKTAVMEGLCLSCFRQWVKAGKPRWGTGNPQVSGLRTNEPWVNRKWKIK